MPAHFPTYRQHKPSGKGVVTLNGRDFYLGPWNSAESRQEFDRLRAEWLANGRQLPGVLICCGGAGICVLIARVATSGME